MPGRCYRAPGCPSNGDGGSGFKPYRAVQSQCHRPSRRRGVPSAAHRDRAPSALKGRGGIGVKRWISSWACVGDTPRRVLPGGKLLSFVSPKESNQRKGDPGSPVRQKAPDFPALLASAGGLRKLAPLRFAQTAKPDGPRRRCAARRLSRERKASQPDRLRRFYGRCVPTPPVRAAEQRRAVGGSRRALSEPEGRVAQPPDRSSSAGELAGSFIAGQPANSGRLFFGYFLLAKQKKVTCRRATPGAAHP